MATRNLPPAATRSRSPRSARWNGSRSTTTTTCAGHGRSPSAANLAGDHGFAPAFAGAIAVRPVCRGPAFTRRGLMPLLARMLAAPLIVDVRRGAVAGLGTLLADRRIAMERSE